MQWIILFIAFGVYVASILVTIMIMEIVVKNKVVGYRTSSLIGLGIFIITSLFFLWPDDLNLFWKELFKDLGILSFAFALSNAIYMIRAKNQIKRNLKTSSD